MADCALISGPLNATGDIVGYGILAALLVNAVVTIAAVLLAYYHDAIEDDLIIDVDHEFRSEVRAMAKFIEQIFKRLFKGILNIVLRRATDQNTTQGDTDMQSDPNTQGNPQSRIALRQRRTACFSQFVLSLSDQQLITGLALLIITVSSQTTLSGHEFSVAHSLAWFSLTTHLATLDILRPVFRSQGPLIFNLRIFGIFFVLGLLTCTSYRVSWQMSQSKLPASCLTLQSDAAEIAQTTLVLLIIWCGYVSRLLDIFSKDGFDLLASCVNWISPAKHSEPTALTPSQRRAKILANSKCNCLLRMKTLQEHFPSHFAVYKHVYQLGLLTFHYNRAFLSTIPMIFFSFSYGICQGVLFAVINAPDLTKEARELGFGQLMALLLLLLPFLAAIEAYGDYKTEVLEQQSPNARHAVVEITELPLHQPEQPASHPYDINFENIKEYLYTAVEDPSKIPEDRRDFLYQEYLGLLDVERKHLMKLQTKRIAWPLVVPHVMFGITLAIGLVIPTDGLLYLYWLMLFVWWLLFQILDFFAVAWVSVRRASPAQRIYEKTECLVQERQLMLSLQPSLAVSFNEA